MEIKNALRSHTLQGSYLKTLLSTATQLGREAVLIINFEDAGVVLECHVKHTSRLGKD